MFTKELRWSNNNAAKMMRKKNKIYNFYLMSKGGGGTVSGKSMEPTLKEDWKIKIEPVVANRIKIGDIVVFGQNFLTCHRIIGNIRLFNKRYFIHRGDNSNKGGIFDSKYLVGRVKEVFDKEKRRIDEIQWKKSFKNIKALGYIYLSMYLIKRCIFQKKINRLTDFINRFCWSLFK